MQDHPIEMAPAEMAAPQGRPVWRLVLVAAVLAALAVVLFASSAFSSSSRPSGPTQQAPAYQQIQKTPGGAGHCDHDMPREQASTSNARLHV